MGHPVDADHNSRDQRVVLAGSNLDASGVPNPEPALGDLSDVVTVALDLHCVPDVQGLLLDLEQLAAGRVLQDQRVPEADRVGVLASRPSRMPPERLRRITPCG